MFLHLRDKNVMWDSVALGQHSVTSICSMYEEGAMLVSSSPVSVTITIGLSALQAISSLLGQVFLWSAALQAIALCALNVPLIESPGSLTCI